LDWFSRIVVGFLWLVLGSFLGFTTEDQDLRSFDDLDTIQDSIEK